MRAILEALAVVEESHERHVEETRQVHRSRDEERRRSMERIASLEELAAIKASPATPSRAAHREEASPGLGGDVGLSTCVKCLRDMHEARSKSSGFVVAEDALSAVLGASLCALPTRAAEQKLRQVLDGALAGEGKADAVMHARQLLTYASALDGPGERALLRVRVPHRRR